MTTAGPPPEQVTPAASLAQLLTARWGLHSRWAGRSAGVRTAFGAPVSAGAVG